MTRPQNRIIEAIDPVSQRHCLEIRRQVFVVEQGIAVEVEQDGLDAQCHHYLGTIDGQPAAAGRLRLHPSSVGYERIATLAAYRGSGLGRLLMQTMQQDALIQWPERVSVLHAQVSALSFYQKLGWLAVGPEFIEAGIAHRVMFLAARDRGAISRLAIWNDPQSDPHVRAFLEPLRE